MLNQDENSSSIIEKLACNEETIARLYKGYADAFPILREFWISLASEEMKHASWIKNLGVEAREKPIYIDEQRFNIVAIQSFTNYLGKELAKVNERKIPLIEALSITFQIEQSLIESKFLEVFQTDSVELKHTLTKLLNDTVAHRDKAKEKLKTYKENL